MVRANASPKNQIMQTTKHKKNPTCVGDSVAVALKVPALNLSKLTPTLANMG